MTEQLHTLSERPLAHPLPILGDDAHLCRERVLRTSIAPLDEAVGGFRSSTTTLLDSDTRYASELLHILCVNALEEFGEEIIWIDGGNEVDPYVLSAMCKRRELDRHEMLSRVNVARAFTAYQLASLVDGFLEDEARRASPSMIVISSMADMFMDRDVRRSEGRQLLRRCADVICGVTRASGAATIVTSHTPGRVKPEPWMLSMLSSTFDVHVQMRTGRDGIGVRVPSEGRSASFTPVPWNQTVLNDFMGGFYGTDGAHVPPRA